MLLFLSIEAKYKAIIIATCESTWLRQLLRNLCGPQPIHTVIYCGNQNVPKISKNLVFHSCNIYGAHKIGLIREKDV